MDSPNGTTEKHRMDGVRTAADEDLKVTNDAAPLRCTSIIDTYFKTFPYL